MRSIFYLLLLVIIAGCSGDDSSPEPVPQTPANSTDPNSNNNNSNDNNNSPNPPSLISPINQDTLVTQIANEEVYFEWSTATDSDNDIIGYRIWIDENATFNNPWNHFVEATNTTSYLEPNKEYFWRVTTRDSKGNVSETSETRSLFLQDGFVPTAPVLIFPIDETECSNVNLSFEWNASSVPSGSSLNYKLYISTVIDFERDLMVYTTSNTTFDPDLEPSTAYYWKVEAYNNSYRIFSKTNSLYTKGSGETNSIPQLEYVSPENNAIISSRSVVLKWQASDQETDNSDLFYKLYVGQVGQELDLAYEGNAAETTLNNLTTNSSYYWVVYVTDEDGATNVGDTWEFQIKE